MRVANAVPAVVALILFTAWSAHAQRQTIGIGEVHITPAVEQSTQKAETSSTLNRIVQSLEEQLIDRVNSTRKFQVIARSDLQDLLKEKDMSESSFVEGEEGGEFRLQGVDYLFVTTVDDFQDRVETASFQGTGKQATKRTLRISAIGKIYDTQDGRLLESANFQTRLQEVSDEPTYVYREGELDDRLMRALAREMADKMANRVVDVIFPAKVIAIRKDQVIINRGDGTAIEPHQIWEAYSQGEELIDPDTGESLGASEFAVGEVRITRVEPKFSQAEILEDYGIEEGTVLRRSEPDRSESD